MDLEPESTFEPYIDPDLEPWEKRYAMWIHLGPLIAGGLMLVTQGVAFFVPTVVALVLWLVRRHDSPFIDDHGREAVNFQISLLVLFVVAWIIGLLLCALGWTITIPLWFVLALAVPGVSGMALLAVLAALALTTAANDINYMLLGGMLAEIAPSRIMGRTSAAAVSVGWTIGIGLALAYMAAFIMFDPFHLELDPSRGEAERLVGPFAGAVMLILCAPLVLLRSPKRAAAPTRAWRVWLREEMASLLAERTIAIAVGARLVYWSGVTLLGLFGAGLARATFDWDTLTTGIFGLTVLAFGAVGALTGGRLDDRVGSRNALIIYLIGLAAAMSGLLAITPDRIFFVIEVTARAPDAAMMSSPAEWAALALGALSGFFVGPTGPISRTLVARLAPPDRRGRYFGVAALAGNSTNAFGPFLVAVMTDLAHDQRIGLLVAPVLLIAGAGVLTLLPSARTARD